MNFTLFISLFFVQSCKKDNPPQLPTLSSIEPSDITEISAISGGNISSDGGAAITSRGVCWDTLINPIITKSKTIDGNGVGSFISNISGLTAGRTYHLRAYAINSVGTSYGEDISFTSKSTSPSPRTFVQKIYSTEATCGGDIVSDGGQPIISRGVCWGLYQNPTIADSKTIDGSGTDTFTSNLTELTPNTTYYVRAYATNSVGTGYGNEITFTTYAVMDFDGNGYYSVSIGNQVWLIENLRVTHYRNGEPIPNIADGVQWSNLTSGAYCYHRNDSTVVNELGILYNWYAINEVRELAPWGWHIATDSEWETLINYLGGVSIAGGKMKETGTTNWFSPNSGADNSSGFTGLSGGQRAYDGEFYGPGVYGCFWTATEENATNARDWFLYNGNATITRYFDSKNAGFNVRCIKDSDL